MSSVSRGPVSRSFTLSTSHFSKQLVDGQGLRTVYNRDGPATLMTGKLSYEEADRVPFSITEGVGTDLGTKEAETTVQ